MGSRAGADIAAVLAGRAREIEDACRDVSDAVASRRPASGAWCVREHLSHLYGDDRETFLQQIRRVIIEGIDEVDAEPGVTHYSIDRRQYPLDGLVAAVSGQYRELAEIAADLDDDILSRELKAEFLRGTSFGTETTLGAWLVAMADWHLPEHIEGIRKARDVAGN